MSTKLAKRLSGFSDCSRKGVRKVKDLYQFIVNTPEIWEVAYNNIRTNKGALTKGTDEVTMDGHSFERSHEIMSSLKNGSYNPTPVRRIYIPKSNGKQRPLGMPNGTDKLVQEVCRIVLESIYEPIFSDYSCGFRPKRGAHDALLKVRDTWTGTKWFIEFDIKGYFDNINHEILIECLEKKIGDKRFIALLRKMLRAGYVEDWKYNRTYSGTPQGGVISPILANIYLHELDVWMEELCQEHSRVGERKMNPKYVKYTSKLKWNTTKLRMIDQSEEDLPLELRERKNRMIEKGLLEVTAEFKAKVLEERATILKERMDLPEKDQHDPEYERLCYVRYADDFVLGYAGSMEKAEMLMAEIKEFLVSKLKLECSEEKTKIKHRTEGVRFLGHDLRTSKPMQPRWIDDKKRRRHKQRIANNKILLWVPRDKMKDFATRHGYGDTVNGQGKQMHRAYLMPNTDLEILTQYNQEIRGFLQYYKYVFNFHALGIIHYTAETSLVKTLAAKYKISRAKAYKKYRYDKRLAVKTSKGYRYWVRPKDINRDKPEVSEVDIDNIQKFYAAKTELDLRRAANKCEYCGTQSGPFEVHHVRKLKDIKKGKASWMKHMMARQRKTMVLCIDCHKDLHRVTLPDRRYIHHEDREIETLAG